MSEFIIIKTTYPHKDSAKKLARLLLQKNLAACVNLQKVDSLYRWENKINEDEEISLEIKTMAKNFDQIAKIIKENHPYDLPQIISIPINSGSEEYLSWIETNLHQEEK